MILSSNPFNCCSWYATFNCFLTHILTIIIYQGATSWEHLHTVDGALYPTYKAACLALGLLEDDREWDRCLSEAATIQTGHQLCHLFAMILEHCIPMQPVILWEKYRASICDDLGRILV